jgi:hypothetical protein
MKTLKLIINSLYSNKSLLTISIGLLCFGSVIDNSAQIDKKIVELPDSLKINATAKDSSLKKSAKPSFQLLKTIAILPKDFSGYHIQRKQIETMDYRFTGDLLLNSPFTYTKNLGYSGLPNEMMLYGQGYNSILFFDNGIELNNRLFNSFDLYQFQNEGIDSIEIIPLTRSFLLGNSGTAAINFISREPIISKPYSRIKYYQAPNEEAFIDGIFSINPFKKTNVYFEITNNSNGAKYKTYQESISDFTSWMGDFRINYFYSDMVNIRLRYKHVSSTIQLFGGVDVDSIKRSDKSSQLEDIIYDNISAPLRFTNRYTTTVLNNATLTAQMRFWQDAPSEFSIYSNNYLSGYRQNYSGTIQKNVSPISRDNKSQTLGARIRQDFKNSFITLNGITFFEHSGFNIDQYSEIQEKDSIRIAKLNGKTENTFAVSVSASLNLMEGNITPGFFAKYLSRANENYFGAGADLFFRINDEIKFYGGISQFEKPISYFLLNHDLETSSQKIQSAEARILFSLSPVNLSLGYFVSKNNSEIVSAFVQSTIQSDEALNVFTKASQIQGVNFSFDASVWKLSVTSNNNFYFSKNDRAEKGLPEFSMTGGIYYIDTLFNSNLKLKSGFNFYGYGSRYLQRFDFEKSISSSYFYDAGQSSFSNGISLLNNNTFSPSFQVDLFIAGRIQESAVIYFTFENLLNSKYSVVPYYPMHAQGIRFGFSWEFLD